jgi:hypothetical protein
MALRQGHRNGKGQPRVEVLPPTSCRWVCRRAASSQAVATSIIEVSSPRSTPSPQGRQGDSRKDAPGQPPRPPRPLVQRSLSAVQVRGGVATSGAVCGTRGQRRGRVLRSAPSSMVASSALQLAWSRYLSDLAAENGDPELVVTASRVANDSRSSLEVADGGGVLERLP